MTPRYDAQRKPEHSTLGDAMERYQRDTDAFQAGAQWALDHLLAQSGEIFTGTLGPALTEYVDAECARLLTRVHLGQL